MCLFLALCISSPYSVDLFVMSLADSTFSASLPPCFLIVLRIREMFRFRLHFRFRIPPHQSSHYPFHFTRSIPPPIPAKRVPKPTSTAKLPISPSCPPPLPSPLSSEPSPIHRHNALRPAPRRTHNSHLPRLPEPTDPRTKSRLERSRRIRRHPAVSSRACTRTRKCKRTHSFARRAGTRCAHEASGDVAAAQFSGPATGCWGCVTGCGG